MILAGPNRKDPLGMFCRLSFGPGQWKKGRESICVTCFGARLPQWQEKDNKHCNSCSEPKARQDFSRTQWEMPAIIGGKCKQCCLAAESTTGFGKKETPREDSPRICAKEPPQANTCVQGEQKALGGSMDKSAASRHFMNCSELELPSVSITSYCAANVLRGRQHMNKFHEDASGIPAVEKVNLLRTAHEEMAHSGGRDAIVKAMKEEGKAWLHVSLDAAFVVTRCLHCRSHSTRQTAKSETRHLPRPMVPGEVVGVDLKTVKPVKGEKWIMLLAVCFCSNKIWTWDIDEGKATLETVQNLLLRFFATEDLPAVCWSDNGGQFKNIVQEGIRMALGVLPRHIPPGRPQANGLTEGYNRILDAAHGGHRDRLIAATIAVNNRPSRDTGVSPETVWRTMRPTQSRWRNRFLGEAVAGARSELTETEWLAYLDEAERKCSDQEMANNIHAKVQPIREAIHSVTCRKEMQRRVGVGISKITTHSL